MLYITCNYIKKDSNIFPNRNHFHRNRLFLLDPVNQHFTLKYLILDSLDAKNDSLFLAVLCFCFRTVFLLLVVALFEALSDMRFVIFLVDE